MHIPRTFLKTPPLSSDPTAIQQQKQPRTVHFAVPLLPASAGSRPASINSTPFPASASVPSQTKMTPGMTGFVPREDQNELYVLVVVCIPWEEEFGPGMGELLHILIPLVLYQDTLARKQLGAAKYSFSPPSFSNAVSGATMTFPLNQSDIAGRA
ncbi:hypothetical protein BT96DRAFT_937338 [Gymnopus androsaceus JB14]|uniref:Uncharacterized protein n=1 Tax=Gymnopus androsaceus JB14 TaxID=1447944 RepID=A0A6A4GNB0_9AGAR|nr:hypothetical protein BT96DRAFT_1005606 [Gymnopus androsaceus JB14]KAE9402183.1 hypothetical protein BT96DRAFT_937338 [Gymnopus androsaceus JB14]